MENKNEFYYTEEGEEPKVVISVNNEKSVKKSKSGFMVFIMCILFGITVGIGIGYTNSLKNEEPSDSVNANEVYSSIIKTVAASNNEGELSIKDIAALTANSVVEITTETVIRGSRLGQFVTEGAGSGVIIDPDGYIVTNNHVIEDTRKIMVKLKNGDIYEATLVGRSTESDIAVLKIDAKNLQAAVLGDSSKLAVGDTAVVVGNPLGSGATVTNGIISAMDREIDLGDSIMNLLQTNAAVNPGNSGGGLFNGKGELVGIVVAKSAGEDIEGIGFAIPINDIKDTISEIKTYGYIRGRVQLGVNLLDVSNTWDAMIYGLDSTGVYIHSVGDNTDASKAGLKSGDKIISIDGNMVTSSDDVKKALSEKTPGDKVTLVISRNGREYTLKITLSEYKGW